MGAEMSESLFLAILFVGCASPIPYALAIHALIDFIICRDQKEKDKWIHKKRWRAGNLKSYFFITGCGEIESNNEEGWSCDDARYTIGNYFKTKEQAEQALSKILQVLKGDE